MVINLGTTPIISVSAVELLSDGRCLSQIYGFGSLPSRFVALGMPLELVGEREHLPAGPAGVAAAAARAVRRLAVDGGAVVAEVVGLRERPVAQLAGEGLGAVGQLVLLEGSQLEQEGH